VHAGRWRRQIPVAFLISLANLGPASLVGSVLAALLLLLAGGCTYLAVSGPGADCFAILAVR